MNGFRVPLRLRLPWPKIWRASSLLLFVALCLLAWTTPVLADDCGRDIFNANDCLRTPGTAQILAGTAATVIAVLVNGFQIVRTVVQPATSGGQPDGQNPDNEDKEQPQRQLLLQIEIHDDAGRARTSLNVDSDDRLRVEAWCEEAGKGPLPAATATIRFSLQPRSAWVELAEAPGSPGRRSASLSTTHPDLRGQPPDEVTLNVSATFEGQTVQGPVPISLVQRRVRVEVLQPITESPVPIVHEDANRVQLRLTLVDKNGMRATAPQGGLLLRLAFEDSSRRALLTHEQEATIEENQGTVDCEYTAFGGAQPRNGGGPVKLRIKDAEGRPAAALGPPRFQLGQDIQFFIASPLKIAGVHVAIDRVAGSNPTDRVARRDKFLVDVEEAKQIAVDLRSPDGG